MAHDVEVDGQVVGEQMSLEDLPPGPPSPEAVRRAVARITDELERARAGGYYRDAWYAYMARWDVETLVAHAEATLPA